MISQKTPAKDNPETTVEKGIKCLVGKEVFKAHVHPEDIAYCTEFCTDGKSENYPIKMPELFQNNSDKRAMSFG